MREKRKVELIESAIKLFADKGFHFTSVQDIVDNCNMSKGAFYNYFESKEALHIAIFQYYFEKINVRLLEIDKAYSDPREKLIREISIPLEHTIEQREFFVIYLREQSSTINKDLQQFIERIRLETVQRYRKILKEIYGEEITPYLFDLVIIIEGLTNSFLASSLFHGIKINIAALPQLILQQVDDAVNYFYQSTSPIVQGNFTLDILANGFFQSIDGVTKTLSLLQEMTEKLEVIPLDEGNKAELMTVLDYLTEKLEKNDWNPLLFQGMLANLKEVPEFDKYRKKIAQLLNIQLL